MHEENQNIAIENEGDPQPGDWWIDEESGELSPCFLPNAFGRLILVDFYGIPFDEFPNYEELPEYPSIDAVFEEQRVEIPAYVEPSDHAEAEEALAKFIGYLEGNPPAPEGNLTRATEFLIVMVARNQIFARKLTDLLMTKHFRKPGRPRNHENVLKKDYRDYAAGRAEGEKVADLIARLARPHGIDGDSMDTRLEDGRSIAERADRIYKQQMAEQMEGLGPITPHDEELRGLFAPPTLYRE